MFLCCARTLRHQRQLSSLPLSPTQYLSSISEQPPKQERAEEQVKKTEETHNLFLHEKGETASMDLNDYTIIREGEAEILMHTKNEVFYNKTQVPKLLFLSFFLFNSEYLRWEFLWVFFLIFYWLFFFLHGICWIAGFTKWAIFALIKNFLFMKLSGNETNWQPVWANWLCLVAWKCKKFGGIESA